MGIKVDSGIMFGGFVVRNMLVIVVIISSIIMLGLVSVR